MEKQLEILDSSLVCFRPKFYLNLNNPLSEDEIKELETKFKVTLPNDLKKLYQWKNGQGFNCYESFVNNSIFMPLEEALESWEESNSMIGSDFDIENWWNENWIPLFHNGGGDHICYDLGGVFTGDKGQLIEFWHADNDRNVIAPSLKSFIEAINEFYNINEAGDFDGYFQINELEGFPKEFLVI